MRFAVITREIAGIIEVYATEFSAGTTDDMTFTPSPCLDKDVAWVLIERCCGHDEDIRIVIFEDIEKAKQHMKIRIESYSRHWPKYLEDEYIEESTPYEYRVLLLEDIETIVENELLK